MGFAEITPQTIKRLPKYDQQQVVPKAIHAAQLATDVFTQTTTETLTPTTLTNGASMSVVSTIVNSTNPNAIVGSTGYGIAFFQDTVADSALIGVSILGDYTINGPFLLPPGVYSATQTDLVYVTEIINTSGVTRDIIAQVCCRVLPPVGGVITQSNTIVT